MDLSVIIPAYNETAVIGATLRDVLTYLQKRPMTYEVIVVDDGSVDDTISLVQNIPEVRLIRHNVNQGKGEAVKTGVLASRGELILFMDADNSTNITELDHFLNEIGNYDIIIGSRALIDSQIRVRQNPLKVLGGRLGNLMIRLVLGLPFRDTQCGFKLFRRETIKVFRQQTIKRWGFDFELIFLASVRGFRILESPVQWVNNFDSKVSSLDYAKTLKDLLSIRLNYLLGKYNR